MLFEPRALGAVGFPEGEDLVERLPVLPLGQAGDDVVGGAGVGEQQAGALQGYGRILITAMVVVMVVVGLLAAMGPARRGLRVAPSEALQAE